MQALEIRNLTKTYRNGFTALRGIDLSVAEGDFFALLGPNGAGKTTAIGIITSLVNKTSGSVKIFGHDIDTELEAAKSCIGVVPQEINLNQWDTAYNCVYNQAGFYGLGAARARERTEAVLRELQLYDRRTDIARNFSGGMKRRLMIARALVHEPRLLMLDEPTAGVDIEIRRSMWEFLKRINEQGTTIILTTHYLEEAENLCRHVGIIDTGRIVGAILDGLEVATETQSADHVRPGRPVQGNDRVSRIRKQTAGRGRLDAQRALNPRSVDRCDDCRSDLADVHRFGEVHRDHIGAAGPVIDVGNVVEFETDGCRPV